MQALLWLKTADVLQIKPPFEAALESLNRYVEADLSALPEVLGLAWELLPGPVAEGALAQVARYFFALAKHPYTCKALCALPRAALCALLAREDLTLCHEDEVFTFLRARADNKVAAAAAAAGPLQFSSPLPKKNESEEGEEEDGATLWSLVRFEELSATPQEPP